MKVAGIDVHKKVLMVVVVDASAPEENDTTPPIHRIAVRVGRVSQDPKASRRLQG